MKNVCLIFISVLLVVQLAACNTNIAQPDDLETDDILAQAEPTAQEESEPDLPEPSSQIIRILRSQIVGEFVDGVARFRDGRHYGLVDIDGNVLAEPIYSEISEFVDGVAIVRTSGPQWGLIDLAGNYIAEPATGAIHNIFDGIACVHWDGRSWLISATDGSLVLGPTLFGSLRLQPGRIAVFEVEGGEFANPFSGTSFGIIDIYGNVIVEPIYSNISNFTDNVATVSLSKSYGHWYGGLMYIDGSWVVEPVERATIRPLSRGLVAFSFDEQHNWGFMNTQGEVVIEPIYAMLGQGFVSRTPNHTTDYIVVFDVFERYFGTPSIHTPEANIAVFQYRVIDLMGNTVYVDNNVYKIDGVSTVGGVRYASPLRVMNMGVRVQDGVNYHPVIVTDHTQTTMFDPNGFYAQALPPIGHYLVTGAEPIEVIVLDDNLQLEWVPIHSGS